MACSATAQPLLNLELSHSHSQQPKRPYSFSLSSFTNKSRLSPKPSSSSQSKDHTKINIFSSPSLFSRQKPGSHVAAQSDYSSGEEAESLLPDSAYQEPFSWSSVIFPFLFPALGGLLFGYDIGATSGATISLQSPELSGTTWFNLSAVQLGLVWFSLWGPSWFPPCLSNCGFPRKEEGTHHCCSTIFAWWCADCFCSRPYCSLSRTTTLWPGYWIGYAWGSAVHRRNLPVSDTWYTDISKGTIHSSGNFDSSVVGLLCGKLPN
ncbi:hypothetical protein V6N13_000950 [Hibiscus sabdariffa]|uniref:Uncharacterized protein n=2 Tax=Hibiscus sabdariffa TaxID=183260 RepID=A0ABR2A868_9ROSI